MWARASLHAGEALCCQHEHEPLKAATEMQCPVILHRLTGHPKEPLCWGDSTLRTAPQSQSQTWTMTAQALQA